MLLPDALYFLTARDKGFPNPEVFIRQVDTSLANATVNSDFTNDDAKARPLFVNQLSMYGSAGAAQVLSVVELYLLGPAPDVTGMFSLLLKGHNSLDGLAAAPTLDYMTIEGNVVIVPPQYRLRAQARFNAGAAANVSRLYIQGLYIPSGTLRGHGL